MRRGIVNLLKTLILISITCAEAYAGKYWRHFVTKLACHALKEARPHSEACIRSCVDIFFLSTILPYNMRCVCGRHGRKYYTLIYSWTLISIAFFSKKFQFKYNYFGRCWLHNRLLDVAAFKIGLQTRQTISDREELGKKIGSIWSLYFAAFTKFFCKNSLELMELSKINEGLRVA